MILRPDDLLKAEPGRWNRDDVAEAWRSCRHDFKAALLDPSIAEAWVLVGTPGSGKTTWSDANDRPDVVIFDAVWANLGRRRAVALQIRASGKQAVAVHVRTPLAACIARNRARQPWRRVPEARMVAMARDLQRCPPTLLERWHRVVWVDGTAILS